MTVEDLIIALQQLPQHLPVVHSTGPDPGKFGLTVDYVEVCRTYDFATDETTPAGNVPTHRVVRLRTGK